MLLTSKVKITYKNPMIQKRQIIPFVDVSVKCCDDQTYWGENFCFSVAKCTSKPVIISKS